MAEQVSPDEREKGLRNAMREGWRLHQAGNLEQAERIYRTVLQQQPDYPPALSGLGHLAYQAGKLDQGLAFIDRAIALNPNQPHFHFHRGEILQKQNRLEEVIQAYGRALQLKPDFPEAGNNLAHALKSQGRIEESLHWFRRSLGGMDHAAVVHSNLILTMQYSPRLSPRDHFNEARAFNDRNAKALTVRAAPHDNEKRLDRRLKVGYVSGDLRQHPVGFFFRGVFEHHDKEAFEIFAFTDVRQPDRITATMKEAADHWIEMGAMDDDALAARVRAEGIDILVDLSGQSGGNRLLAFARKPAPVQVTAGGFFCTTGLDAIDYVIGDHHQMPMEATPFFSEHIVRMPHDNICYTPPEYAPPVIEPPVERNGYVTFGCFNALTKVTPEVIAVWAAVLKAVPDSHFLMRAKAMEDAQTRVRFLRLFGNHGVPPYRFSLLSGSGNHQAFLGFYGDMDISLDPFPYNGGLTTLESLWMGVPVVTLRGETMPSRHSMSHLTNAGLKGLIARTPEEYVRIATDLAGDRDKLRTLRAGMRRRMVESPICDCPRYTKHLEAAYREMWRQYCAL